MVDASTVKGKVVIESPSGERHMAGRAWAWLIFALLAEAVFFFFVCRSRFIDGDEGAFLLAAKLVLAHKKPYLDFFFQQAPLLPYVYAGWLKAVGATWIAGRLLCLVLATLLGGLIYVHVARLTQSICAALAAVILYATSTLVFAWFSVVKTHCLAGLLLFGAYVVVTRHAGRLRSSSYVLAGALLGLSIDTRSYILLLIPVFLVWTYRASDAGGSRPILWFCIGLALGTLPSTYFFLSSPDAFLFNNLRYHALRTNAGLIGWWQEKVFTVVELFLWGPEANGLQWSILFFTSVGFVFSIPDRKYPPRLAFGLAATLSVICLLPTPAYLQYFSLCVPFLVVSSVCGLFDLYERLTTRKELRMMLVVCAVLLVGYISLGLKDLRAYTVTGDGVPGVHIARDRGDWTLPRVIDVAQIVDHYVGADEAVASFWSGDIFQSRARSVTGLESPFSLTVADKLTPAERSKYHIVTLEGLEGDLAARQPRVVVIRDELSSAFSQEELPQARATAEALKRLISSKGYQRVRSIGGISIYVCCGN